MKWEFEDFVEHYKPVKNNLSSHAGYDGYLFEDVGDDLEYIRDVRPEYIWTLVEGDYGSWKDWEDVLVKFAKHVVKNGL